MRRAHICYFLVLFFIVTLGASGCGARPKTAEIPAAPKVPAPQTQGADRTGWPLIITFGDSLTQGQGVLPEQNYPSRLQVELDKQGYKYRVQNAGISGDTSSGGLGRVDLIISQKPAIVILELGANDGLQGQPIAQMRQNLSRIVERLQAAKIQVVLAGMQIPPNYGPDYSQDFSSTFPTLAATYHTALIPFLLDGVGGHPDLNQSDGIHPTGAGYVFVVNNVMAALQPLLTKP